MLEFRELTQMSIIIRIVGACFIGGLIGLERETNNHPAGLRTYMMVCVGACLIMMTNQYSFQLGASGDPMRLGAQVVSGIGFLGAGTIIVTRHNKIKGLTTAAGLWSAAGVGLALGIGFYEAAITAAVCIYLILTLLHQWEHRLRKKVRRLELYIELKKDILPSVLIQNLRAMNINVERIQFEQENTLNENAQAMVLSLKSIKKKDHSVLIQKIRELDEILHLEEF